MIITIIENSTSNREQKLNKNEFGNNIFNEVKKIIDEDPFGLFQIKNSVSLDHKIKEINSKIESFVKINTQVKKEIEKNQTVLETVKTKNNEMIKKMKLGIK